MTPFHPATSSAAAISRSHNGPERLALVFFARVWAPPHDLAAIDELMTEDYTITSGGVTIRGRGAGWNARRGRRAGPWPLKPNSASE